MKCKFTDSDQGVKGLEQAIETRLQELGKIGRTPTHGLWRRPYTQDDKEAKALVSSWMTEYGMVVREDPVGNLYGRVEGQYGGPSILAGSHLDTVKNGGIFDGAVGIVSALEAIRLLTSENGKPRLPLEVVCTSEEEGTRFPGGFVGSRAIIGDLKHEDLETIVDKEGVTLKRAIEQYGLDPSRLDDSFREDIGAYLEVHVEQGRVLEDAGIPLGVVTAIAGNALLDVEVLGLSDHAGGTPMDLRRDSLTGAAQMVLRIEGIAKSMGHPAVATVGRLECLPGAPNVIPGLTQFSVDIRHAELAEKDCLTNSIIESAQAIAAQRGLSVKTTLIEAEPPAIISHAMSEMLRQGALDQGIPYMDIVSGALHDAQVLSKKVPIGMLFVPSKGGRSHCPEEYSSARDIASACRVLAYALKKIAYDDVLSLI